LLVDAAPHGSQIPAIAGLAWTPGMVELASQDWQELTEDRLRSCSQPLGPQTWALVGATTGVQAISVLESLADRLVEVLADFGRVVVDGGRLAVGTPVAPFVAAADAVVVVVRQAAGSQWATGGQVAKARGVLEWLADSGVPAAAVVVGDRPYPDPDELADALAAPVLAMIPYDPKGADSLAEAARRGDLRPRLMRSAGGLADAVDRFVKSQPSRTGGTVSSERAAR
jgi:hypothetical protein